MQITCKNCGGKNLVKKGNANTKHANKQVYLCKDCQKKFVDTKLAHKTYSPKMINAAISNYNLGYTLEETIKLVNRRFKTHLPKSTLNGWVHEFKPIAPYHKIRKHIVKQYAADKIIISKKFEHNGLQYNFKFHQAKLNYLCEQNGFENLQNYINKVLDGTPSFFGEDKRCSQPDNKIFPKAKHTNNVACQMAEMAISAKKNNFERHQLVEDYFLYNDANTIAAEVPVWFWDKNEKAGWSGHIDLLQIRRGLIFIVDYKPDAKKEKKAAAQLLSYTTALSFRTGIPKDKFRCMWFDDKDYFEFNPNTI